MSFIVVCLFVKSNAPMKCSNFPFSVLIYLSRPSMMKDILRAVFFSTISSHLDEDFVQQVHNDDLISSYILAIDCAHPVEQHIEAFEEISRTKSVSFHRLYRILREDRRFLDH